MNINLDTLVEMVEKALTLSEESIQTIYKTSTKLRINNSRSGDANPVTYVKNTLVPSLRQIQGVDIQDIQARPEKVS